MSPRNPCDRDVGVSVKSDDESGSRVRISNDVGKEILSVARLVIDSACVAGVRIRRSLRLKCNAFLIAPCCKQEKEKAADNRRNYCYHSLPGD